MTRLRLRTPSRLHFGLLAWNPASTRQFGSVGLMIDAPGVEVTAQASSLWQAEGPLARRTLQLAERVAAKLVATGVKVPPARFQVVRAAPEHVGLGTGTQLALAVARLVTELAAQPEAPATTLAALAGRGLRSGIGLHGFERGGLIVDAGHRTGSEGSQPPLLSHLVFPADWAVLVIVPGHEPGLHGLSEKQAFATLPPIPEPLTDRLCRLVLLGLLPAVIEGELEQFGAALSEIQGLVGKSFAPAQGGTIVRPELEPIVAYLRSEKLQGVGQSSWGPSLYGFSAEPPDRRTALLTRLQARFGLKPDSAFWTSASATGARLVRESGD